MCQPKNQGGLSIIDLEVYNECLLSKWLYKLLNEDDVYLKLLGNSEKSPLLSPLPHELLDLEGVAAARAAPGALAAREAERSGQRRAAR